MSRLWSSHHTWCHGHYCRAMRNVTGTVVAWLRWASYCGRCCCMATFCVMGTVIVWPWWVSSHCIVSRALSLRGRGGHHVVWPWQVSSRCILCRGHHSCVAAVGVVLCGHGGCHYAAFCVAGAVVAWPWWVSCCGRVCCMAVVGVVAPCCVAVGVVAWSQWVSSHHVGPQ
jgi:hypothetical protein